MNEFMRISYLGLASVLLLLNMVSCTDDNIDIYANIDKDLTAAIAAVSPTGLASYYALPHSGQYNRIPQMKKTHLPHLKLNLGSNFSSKQALL